MIWLVFPILVGIVFLFFGVLYPDYIQNMPLLIIK